jgi:hypothetical protein
MNGDPQIPPAPRRPGAAMSATQLERIFRALGVISMGPPLSEAGS